jgi:hypothetical protein
MLGLVRSAGDWVDIRIPQSGGIIRVDVDAVDASNELTELAVSFRGMTKKAIGPKTLRRGEELHIEVPRGELRIVPIVFSTGPNGYGASVRIGFDAPRNWRIERHDIKTRR